MPEVNAIGAPSTAATSFVFYSLLLDIVAVAIFRKLVPATRRALSARPATAPASEFFHVVMLAFAFISAGYMFLAGLRTGFPLLTGTDRFEFRLNGADTIVVNFLDLKIIPALALGTCAAFGRSFAIRLLAHGLFFFGVVGVSLLYGDKFFIILFAASQFIIPFFARNPHAATKTLLKLLPYGFIGICLLAATTLYTYSEWGAHDLGYAIQRLGDRVSGQGQLWYLAVKEFSRWFAFDGEAISGNISSLFVSNSASYVFTHNLGPFFFTSRYSTPAIYWAVVHNVGATTPTELFEAYGLVMVGYTGLVIQMMMAGFLIGLINAYIVISLRHHNPFYLFLPAFLTVAASKLISQGTLFSVLSMSSGKFYLMFATLSGAVAICSRLFPRKAEVVESHNHPDLHLPC